MTTYLVVLIFLLLLGFLIREYTLSGRNSINVNIAIGGIGCFALFALAAFRASSVGADTQQYIEVFNWVKTLSFNQLSQDNAYVWWGSNIEYTYKVYNWLVSRVSMHQQAITVANSLALSLALLRFVKNESPNAWLSIFLFFTLGMYQLSLNLTPSSIAALIALGSYKYVRERRIVRYVGWVLLASFFHMSAFLFIILYFIHNIKLNQKQFLIALSIGLALALFAAQPVLRLLASVAPDSYKFYLSTESVRLEQLFVLVAYAILITLALLSGGNKSLFEESNNDIRWMILIIGILYAFAASSTGITRIAFLFAPFITAVVPRLLYDGKLMERFNGSAKLERASRPSETWMFLTVTVAMVLYLARISINNIGTTMPYEIFF